MIVALGVGAVLFVLFMPPWVHIIDFGPATNPIHAEDLVGFSPWWQPPFVPNMTSVHHVRVSWVGLVVEIVVIVGLCCFAWLKMQITIARKRAK